jgi:hypothetical protein
MNSEFQMELLILAGVWLVVMLIGYVIGRARGRGGFGAFMGLLLGPLGWLIVLLLPRQGTKCPECLGIVPAQARRCQHCGSEIPAGLSAEAKPFRRRVI